MTENSNSVSSFSIPYIFLRCMQYLFFLAGLCAVGYVGFTVAHRHAYQAYHDGQVDDVTKPDSRPAPTPAVPIPIGHVIGKVEIPRLGLESVVVQGDSEKILSVAVGHVPGTAFPGQSGNMALAGHRDTFFRALRNVRLGDRILVQGPDGSYDYEVESTSVVAPTDLSVLRSSRDRELTLITCYPFSWIGSAPNRFIVRAQQIEPSS